MMEGLRWRLTLPKRGRGCNEHRGLKASDLCRHGGIYLEGKPSKARLPAAPHQVFGPALRHRRKGSEEAGDALEAAVGCQLHEVHALQ
jgi:hypothetical protein